MKTIKCFGIHCLIALGLFAGVQRGAAQGTAITYQGRLTVSSNAAAGSYDFTFKLFNANTGGTQAGSTIMDNGVGVTNGLFTVLLDFGAVYDGTPYWLELAVRTNSGGSFVTVLPRQELTPAPYAIAAENVSGPVPAGQIQGPLVGSTATPLFEVDQNGTGLALYGNHTTSTGTSAGVEGITSSDDDSAAAVIGLVNSTAPGGYSSGVLGQNNGAGGLGIGVTGIQSGSGWGVYGETPTGYGVYGESAGGLGVRAFGATGLQAESSTYDGIDGTADAAAGIGVSGDHSAGTGTAAGVQGSTESTDGSALAVYGLITATNPGGFSAAVRGQNNGVFGSGIGVWGSHAGSGWGVYGTSVSGYGVLGTSTSSLGVYGVSSSSTGVEGDSGSTADYATAVYGLMTTTTPGSYSAAVKGQNSGTDIYGIGVWGNQDGGGFGVYGTAPAGWGVYALGATGVYAEGTTNEGVAGQADSDNGVGVLGIHSSGNGTAAGVEGDTDSTDDGAAGVLGVVESTTPGGFSAAVMGQNNGTDGNGIGVYGTHAGSGWGVLGSSANGIGVYGYSTGGTAMRADSGTISGAAFTVGEGAIHVTGAGVGTSTAAFIQTATANNLEGAGTYITVISNSICDGDPNAILIATHQYSPPGQLANYNTHPYSVWYDGSHWTIYNDDKASIEGQSFNVLIIKN